MFRERRWRDRWFPGGLFGEPAWDMLLVLFRGHDEQAELRQIDLFNEVGVPHTTALRTIEKLEKAGLVERLVGGSIYRKRVVRLTADAIERMERCTGISRESCDD